MSHEKGTKVTQGEVNLFTRQVMEIIRSVGPDRKNLPEDVEVYQLGEDKLYLVSVEDRGGKSVMSLKLAEPLKTENMNRVRFFCWDNENPTEAFKTNGRGIFLNKFISEIKGELGNRSLGYLVRRRNGDISDLSWGENRTFYFKYLSMKDLIEMVFPLRAYQNYVRKTWTKDTTQDTRAKDTRPPLIKRNEALTLLVGQAISGKSKAIQSMVAHLMAVENRDSPWYPIYLDLDGVDCSPGLLLEDCDSSEKIELLLTCILEGWKNASQADQAAERVIKEINAALTARGLMCLLSQGVVALILDNIEQSSALKDLRIILETARDMHGVYVCLTSNIYAAYAAYATLDKEPRFFGERDQRGDSLANKSPDPDLGLRIKEWYQARCHRSRIWTRLILKKRTRVRKVSADAQRNDPQMRIVA